MKRCSVFLLLLVAVLCSAIPSGAQQPRFKVLAFYSTNVEPDHVQFAETALKFFAARAGSDNFTFDSTTDWERMNDAYLKAYQVVVWLNNSPTNEEQRRSFQRYMENGGAWLGFHFSGYNDKDTNWPWFVDFLGGAVFHINSWPPLPAKLVVDDRTHPIASGIPDAFESPANEWYMWKPSPRLNKDVHVLVTLDPSNYPLGLKDILTGGDIPVVWTNTKYKMIYMNMGHGDKIFTSPIQNKLIENAANWLGMGATDAAIPPASGTEISPRGIALNSATHKVYAVNTTAGTVTVLGNAGHSPTEIKVGAEPESIAVNPTTNRIYVANSGSSNVSVIDGAADRVVATVNVGDLPYVIATNPVTNKVYVSRTFSNSVTVIDGATNGASNLKAGIQADAIAVDSAANRLYLMSYESTSVTVIDGANESITTVAAGNHLWGMAVNSITSRVYLANTGNSNVTVLDGKTNVTTLVNTGDIPCALAVDPSTGRVYAVNYGSDSVTVIDGVSNSVVTTVKVGARPQAIAVDPGNHRVYVANTHDNTVSVIDGESNSVAATIKTGDGPYAIAVDSTTHTTFVTNISGPGVTVIDGHTLSASPSN
ncbi:MAG: ThuA domain-containing protein [Candidatus Sulfotelmatobacter sp.]